jgi:hypothetical protein
VRKRLTFIRFLRYFGLILSTLMLRRMRQHSQDTGMLPVTEAQLESRHRWFVVCSVCCLRGLALHIFARVTMSRQRRNGTGGLPADASPAASTNQPVLDVGYTVALGREECKPAGATSTAIWSKKAGGL